MSRDTDNAASECGYVIHATFVIVAESPDDAEKAVQTALLDDDLTPRWHCKRTWWTGEKEGDRA